MSCYFRHIKDILDEAGIAVTSDNRKKVDQAIRQIIDMPYQDCPTTWKGLKQQVMGDGAGREEFIRKLKQAVLRDRCLAALAVTLAVAGRRYRVSPLSCQGGEYAAETQDGKDRQRYSDAG